MASVIRAEPLSAEGPAVVAGDGFAVGMPAGREELTGALGSMTVADGEGDAVTDAVDFSGPLDPWVHPDRASTEATPAQATPMAM